MCFGRLSGDVVVYVMQIGDNIIEGVKGSVSIVRAVEQFTVISTKLWLSLFKVMVIGVHHLQGGVMCMPF